MANEVFLGSVYATLELRDKEWKDKLDESANEIDKLENKVNNKMASVGAGFKSAGQALSVGLTAPILAVGTAITLSAATFDKQMSSIKALTGATGKEMETLRKLALQAGAETAFSAKEAAQGIEELLKAGVSTTDVLNGGLYAALNLATAGDLQLAEAAEIASTALNAFKADNLSVADAANILAGAANASATDVHELRYALAASSAVASAIGISFKDTNTALAVFAQNGLKGSDAGTSLKTMLLNLQPTTEKQISLFQTLGLMTADGANQFFTAEGKAKSLADISGVLQKSLGGLSDQERLLALEMLFGSDAIRAANILYKEGEKGLTDMSSAMGKVTAADVAKEKLNNLSGSVEQFKGSVETASIGLGELTQGPLKSLVDLATDAVNSFNDMSTPLKQFALVAGIILAAVGPLLIVIGSITTAFTALSVATGLAALPLIGIIAAIVAVALVVALLVAYWEPIKKFFIDLWVKIQEAFKTGWQAVSDFFTVTIPAFIDSVVTFFNDLPINLMTMFGNLLLWMISWAATLIALVVLSAIKLVTDVLNWFKKLPENTSKLMEEVLKWFSDRFSDIKNFIFNIVPEIIKNTITWFKELPTNLSNILSDMFQKAKSGFENIWKSIVGEVSSWPKRLYDWGTNMINSFADGIKAAFGRVVEAVREGLERARKMLQGNSPPVEGPFKHIDQWGFNVGMAWSDGLTSAIGSIESLVTGDVNVGAIRQPAPAFSSVPNQTTNSPVFNISLGNFLGTETEFRQFSRDIIKAYENYQKGAGESIID